jgi:hypothetical protein
MAVTWFIPRGKERLEPITDRASLLRQFEGQQRVAVGTGITCAFLGDERNLREYLVAADAVRVLKQAGHIVSFYLFDDSLDALTPRQLRVAVKKDPVVIDKYQQFCGMPIADIPSPEPGSNSWAEHFESLLLKRLAQFGCFPTLESASHLYEMGAYQAFVKIVLERGADITRFLERDFPEYSPQALFYPICPACGRIKGTRLTYYNRQECVIECEACSITATLPSNKLRGKLNWKLDCAARWRIFNIDIEPFTKAYLEPTAGAYWIAQALGREFFGSGDVRSLNIGVVKVDENLDPSAMKTVPSETLKKVFVERWNNDIHLTRERLMLAASKPDAAGEPSFLDRVKRDLPTLKVKGDELTPEEYAFVKQAEAFQHKVMGTEEDRAEAVSGSIFKLKDGTLWGLRMLLRDALHLRQKGANYDLFDSSLKFTSEELGEFKSEVHQAVRSVLNHRKGLPVRRLLFTVPLPSLDLILYAVERTLESRGASMQLAHERISSFVNVEKIESRVTRLA